MRKELKIGLIMIIAIGSVIWGVNFLKGKNFFSNTRRYYVIYDDINGLVEANGVFIKGYKVGHVSEIDFSDKTLTKLKVILAIESDILIPEGSKARIYSIDLLSNKAVELIFSNSKHYLKAGDTLVSDMEISVAKQLEPYKIQLYHLLSSSDSLSNSILKIFNAPTISNLRTIFNNLKVTSNALALNSDYLTASFDNIESITQNFKDNNKRINKIVKNLDILADSLSHLQIGNSISKLNQTLDETQKILTNLQAGQGTLGKILINDSLYFSFMKSVADMDSLINDIKANPNRYINVSLFGSHKKK